MNCDRPGILRAVGENHVAPFDQGKFGRIYALNLAMP
jgi:hypothetical protein